MHTSTFLLLFYSCLNPSSSKWYPASALVPDKYRLQNKSKQPSPEKDPAEKGIGEYSDFTHTLPPNDRIVSLDP